MTRAEASRWLMGAFYVAAGLMHFITPEFYLRLVPPYVSAPGTLVALSGVAEIAGGLGVLSAWPAVRRAAGWGLVALLIAVYPANVHAATTMDAPFNLLWVRLPLQGVLVAWALHASGILAYWAASKSPGHARRARSTGYGA